MRTASLQSARVLQSRPFAGSLNGDDPRYRIVLALVSFVEGVVAVASS